MDKVSLYVLPGVIARVSAIAVLSHCHIQAQNVPFCLYETHQTLTYLQCKLITVNRTQAQEMHNMTQIWCFVSHKISQIFS